MALDRTKLAYEEIQSHITKLPKNHLIESYFVQYLLIRFYSEMEEAIKSIIKRRVEKCGDEKLASYVTKSNESMMKRIKKAEINDFLKLFACGDGDIIGDLCGDRNLQPYFDAITNRHLTSHSDGGSMTLAEFSQSIECAELILEKVEHILWQ